MIEPGLEQATDAFKKTVYAEVKQIVDSIYATHARDSETEVDDQRPHRRFRISASANARDEYSVLATSNLNGDYLSDACAAQVGGLGMAPGSNIGDGFGVFEPRTVRAEVRRQGCNQSEFRYAFGRDDVEFLGWKEAATLIEDGIARTIQAKARDIRPRAPDARNQSWDLRVCLGHH